MIESLTSRSNGAIPITPVSAAGFPQWLDAHPATRDWLAAVGFRGEPGTFAFLAGSDQRASAVLAAPAEGEPVWAFAGLAAALPEGTYAIDARDGVSPNDVALGWALGAYAFTKYKQPKRRAATLVWPAEADRAEVERIAQAVYIVRDLINTPAEDMGPAAACRCGTCGGKRSRREDAHPGG